MKAVRMALVVGGLFVLTASQCRDSAPLNAQEPAGSAALRAPAAVNIAQVPLDSLCLPPTAPPAHRSDHVGISANSNGLYNLPLMARAFRVLATSNAGWVRMPLDWSRIQPTPGVFKWAESDSLVAMAQRNGFRVLLYPVNTPKWATSAVTPRGRLRSEKFPPCDSVYWQSFVRHAAEHFRGRVDTWEIWNEPSFGFDNPDCPNGSWCGSAAQYASLLRTGAEEIRKVSPDAKVLVGGLVMSGKAQREDFLGSILHDPHAPAAENFDILNIHSYGATSLQVERADAARKALASAGRHLPLWITETGYSSDPAYAQVPEYVGETGQAEYLCAAFKTAISVGADKLFWFKPFDPPPNGRLSLGTPERVRHMGLLDADLRPKPAFWTLKNIASRW